MQKFNENFIFSDLTWKITFLLQKNGGGRGREGADAPCPLPFSTALLRSETIFDN